MMLDNKIGFGKAQYKLVIPLLFLLINQGAQMLALGLFLPMIKKEWNISTLEEAVGLTIINSGILVGSVLVGFSDKVGRSPIILVNAIMTLVFGLLTAISWNFYVFVATRFCIAIGVGMFLPLIGAYTAEIAPTEERGTLLSNIYVLWAGGYIFCIVCGYYFLIRSQWRMVSLILCIPAVFAIVTFFILGR